MKEKLFKIGKTRRLFSALLALAMVVGLMPITAISVQAEDSLLPDELNGMTATWNVDNPQRDYWIKCAHNYPVWNGNEKQILNWNFGSDVTMNESDLTAGTYKVCEYGCTLTLVSAHTPGSGEHGHSYDMEHWSYDKYEHWHRCTSTSGICDEPKCNIESHSMVDGKCSVCDYAESSTPDSDHEEEDEDKDDSNSDSHEDDPPEPTSEQKQDNAITNSITSQVAEITRQITLARESGSEVDFKTFSVNIDGGTEINSLSHKIVSMILNAGSPTIYFKYMYNGLQYTTAIPAGTVFDPTIEYFGPLYLMNVFPTVCDTVAGRVPYVPGA